MTKIDDENLFKTTDLAFCSALQCLGFQIEISKTEQKAVFYIKRNKRFEELFKAYFSHMLQVDPLAFFNAIKELKTRIYHT